MALVNFAEAVRATSAPRDILRRLVVLRFFVWLMLSIFLAVAWFRWDVQFPLGLIATALLVLCLLNVLTRVRLSIAWPVTEFELFGNLAGDVLVLTGLLYFTGGSTNPLVSLYLLPLMVAATTLPARYNWSVGLLAVFCYTFLMFEYRPPGEQHAVHDEFATKVLLHVLGMWATFVVSALLVMYFVAKMAHSLREQDRNIARVREASLRDEQLVALGTLAAGAAHELSTPLGTMAILADDMAHRYEGHPALTEDLAEMHKQITNCKSIIGALTSKAGAARGESGCVQAADSFLDEVLTKWLLMRPTVNVRCRWADAMPAPAILVEQTLSQAVISLLNNAADASPHQVEIVGRSEAGQVMIEIMDRGPGLSEEVKRRAGEPFFSTKSPAGLGIGLLLANATVERLGGTVSIFNREGGGACTCIALPAAATKAAS